MDRMMSAGELRERALSTPGPALSLAAAPRELRAIIIDAARGERRLDSRRSEPASFTRIDGHGRVLDWVLHALRVSEARSITFVGGYHIQKVIAQYPELQFRYLAGWTERGEVEALRTTSAPGTGDCDLLIARATSLCLPEAIERLRREDSAISLGLYDDGQGRAAWAGLMHVPAEHAEDVFAVAEEVSSANARANLTDMIAVLEGRGLPMSRVRIDGLAARLEDESAVSAIAFRGKARTLEQIAPLVRGAVVPESMRFSTMAWDENAAAIVETVAAKFGSDIVAVRSSAACEDQVTVSLAGRFRSVLNVQADDAAQVRDAIAAVVASFAQRDRLPSEGDEVIVQRQVQDLNMCGVLLTRDLSTGGPYFVVHVAPGSPGVSAEPDRVTAGTIGGTGVHYVLRAPGSPRCGDRDIGRAVELARELEKLTCREALDIEFGVTSAGEMNLLQVRPLAQPSCEHGFDDDLQLECAQIHVHVKDVMREHPLLAGATTVLSSMADWNPAEMIGPAPKPLALSLYQRLIGSSAWSASRTMLGYRDVGNVPLVHSLGGRPYVDVRASLNSLLPAAIDETIAAMLVNDGIARLKRDPSAHDKIEFEIAHSCATLDVERDRARLRDAGLGEGACDDVMRALAGLTDNLLVADCAKPQAALTSLERVLGRLRADRVASMHGCASRLQMTLAACAAHGTTPFAVQARQAFVALAMLRSLRALGVFSVDEHEELLKSIPTVASELDRDLSLWSAGMLTREALVARYGHLRPSSYDVTSLSYGSAWARYFGESSRWRETRPFPDVTAARAMLERKRSAIERLLRASGLTAPFEAFCEFVIGSIQARECGKFIFMQAVHDVLELAAAMGELLEFDREDVAMLPVHALEGLAFASPSGAVEMEWGRLIEFNRKRWALTSALRLPGVIRKADDVFAFEVEGSRPTFVSRARVAGRAVHGDGAAGPSSEESWRGAIVLLRAADPGYDWLFSKGIAGLITAWGGAGSHMAIRAAEFGLPAAIGCGELMFDSLLKAHMVELDCGVQTVRVLS